ncbi:MAG TPA: YIP1 family protein, partial [Sphingobium sp.]|nr:YIP1 family protein [Sphingobium sp.]
SIADMSAMGAMAALGAAMGVESSREDADGYERTTNRDGNMLVEKWRNSGDGSYGAMIGNRFFVEAEGAVESIDELKAAVARIDQRRLLALAQ